MATGRFICLPHMEYTDSNTTTFGVPKGIDASFLSRSLTSLCRQTSLAALDILMPSIKDE